MSYRCAIDGAVLHRYSHGFSVSIAGIVAVLSWACLLLHTISVMQSCSMPGRSWDLACRQCNLTSFISDLILIAEQLLLSN